MTQRSDTKRPSLLFLCQTLPYPPDGGVQIRSYNVLRQLAREFDVTALCFYRARTRPGQEDVERGVNHLRRFGAVRAFPFPHELSRARLLWDHVRSVATRRPYTYYTHESDSVDGAIHDLLARQKFDVIHLDSLDLSRYADRFGDVPVICTHHNVESSLLARRARTESNPALSAYFRLQSRLTEAEERRWCGRFALNVTVSDADAQLLTELVPGAPVTVVPNGVDTATFQPSSDATDGIVFVGGAGWFPNLEGMRFFAREILPLVRRDRDVPVTWVGRAPDRIASEFDEKFGIRLTGYVDDIRPHVADAACYIVPLLTGGGTRLKILDAWAMGKAIVSTSIGCEGLATRDGGNILVRDDPVGFARAILDVLDDGDLRRRLGAGARETAATVYDWDVIGAHMLREYARLV